MSSMPSTERIQSIIHVQVPESYSEEGIASVRASVESALASGTKYPVVITNEGITITSVAVSYADNDILDFPFDEDEGSTCCQ